MALRPLSDVTPADWFVRRLNAAPRGSVGGVVPGGFDAYARLDHEPQEYSNPSVPEGHLPKRQLTELLAVLSSYTGKDESVYCALWEGFGEIHGGEAVSFLTAPQMPAWFGRIFGAPKDNRPPPAFPQSFLDGPKIETGALSFLLFKGQLSDVGNWGTADYAPGVPRGEINSPSFMWPEGRSWFVSTHLELTSTFVAGERELIDTLANHPRLRAHRVPAAEVRYEEDGRTT